MGASMRGEGWGGDRIVAVPPVLRRVAHLYLASTTPHSPPVPGSQSMSPLAPRAQLTAARSNAPLYCYLYL